MSTYVTHEEGLDPVFQTFLEVARSRANMSASHSPSLHPHDYELAAQHLESLETSAAEFGAKMQHHLATHRRVLNALLPIHRIPSEIFTEILAMSLVLWSEDANEKYQEHLYTLRCVSAAWRTLIDNSPLLWATVSCRDTLDTVRNALAKSKDSPLEVVYRARYVARYRTAEFIVSVVQHVHRWKSLEVLGLNSQQATELLDLTDGCQAPKLQKLSLVNTGDVRCMGSLFDGQTHQLRRIKLSSSYLVPWSPTTLSNLHFLHIDRVMQEGPSADQVDIILRASPALVELILQAVYPRGDDAPPIKQRHPVELLSLRKLTVVRLTPELTTHILENIRIPNCENIIILAETSTKAAYTPSQSFLHSAHKIMGASDSARVELGAQLFSLKCWKQGKIALKVCLRGEAWAFNTAESSLRLLDPSLDLSIIIDTNSPTLTKIFNLLPSLGGARALQLTQHRQAVYDGSNALISELGVVKMANGVFRWPLPLLETLRVRSSSLEVGALLGVIRARLEAEVEPPSKLKALHLAKNLKRYFRELENTLGEGVVSCYNSGLDSYELFGGSESGSEPDCIVDEESESDAEGEDEDESDLETEAQLHYQYRGRNRR
ncbi:hypothetical protein FRB98_006784 [Tulasnella sp. 332]|nr:hypothetical protein FRB98_006784 [Tulasnella sp. 332]